MHGLGHPGCQPLANRAPHEYPAEPSEYPGPRPGIRAREANSGQRDPRVSVDQEMPDLVRSTARPGPAGSCCGRAQLQRLPAGGGGGAAHPSGGDRAAVVGAPDDTWVEAVTAFITLRPGASASEDELRQAARARLAGYKVPK